MRCKQEEFQQDAVFHFYNKTVSPKKLFQCEDDYQYLLLKFRKNLERYPGEVFAYCLMPNHFHFCMKQISDKPLYRIFNDSFCSYALHYNHKYNVEGPLFKGKLQHKRVTNDCYLLSLCGYIHYNPVKAGLVKEAIDWPFSNCAEYAGVRKGALYSKELYEMYPEEFQDYGAFMREYGELVEDRDFDDLLFD